MILEFENALSDNCCDALIEFFENNTKHHERLDKDGAPNFTQLRVPRAAFELEEEVRTAFLNIHGMYRDQFPFVPALNAFEQPRIKKYTAGGTDRFDQHVDVVDHVSARRALAIQFYLNTVSNGGRTLFEEKAVLPIKGNAFAFPPMWTYPHRGEAPMSNDKYILTTYVHYI